MTSNPRNDAFAFTPEIGREAIGTAIGSGQDWMRKAAAAQAEWLELCQSQSKRAMDGAQALARCKDFSEGLALQTDLMRGMVEAYATGTQRIAAIWTETPTDVAAKSAAVAAAPYRQAAE